MHDIIAEIYGTVTTPAVALPESLPGMFRLTRMERKPGENGITHCTAQLYHEKASLRVTWECRQLDTRLHEGTLVSPRWLGKSTRSEQGAVRISRLVLLEIPQASATLFDTVPMSGCAIVRWWSAQGSWWTPCPATCPSCSTPCSGMGGVSCDSWLAPPL